MKTCENCGLGLKEESGDFSCFKYKTLNKPQEDKQSCGYYIEIIIEEGEPLLPIQHLILREEQLKVRMIRGVV